MPPIRLCLVVHDPQHSLPGQGNKNPRPGPFIYHLVVQLGTTYYDPSYGRSYVAITTDGFLAKFEQTAVGGYEADGPVTVRMGVNTLQWYFKQVDPQKVGITINRRL